MKARRILHPSDFSSASRAAFARAVADARAERAELLLVHVLPAVMPLVGDGYMSPKTYDDMEPRTAGARARGLLLEGTAADAIVRTARANGANVIVMGTHGRSGLARLFMGSVAERVVGTAPCPVLTVRGK